MPPSDDAYPQNGRDPAAQQLSATSALADVIVVNDADLERLAESLDTLIADLSDD